MKRGTPRGPKEKLIGFGLGRSHRDAAQLVHIFDEETTFHCERIERRLIGDRVEHVGRLHDGPRHAASFCGSASAMFGSGRNNRGTRGHGQRGVPWRFPVQEGVSRGRIHTNVHTFIHNHIPRYYTLVCPLIAQTERVLESLGRFQLDPIVSRLYHTSKCGSHGYPLFGCLPRALLVSCRLISHLISGSEI